MLRRSAGGHVLDFLLRVLPRLSRVARVARSVVAAALEPTALRGEIGLLSDEFVDGRVERGGVDVPVAPRSMVSRSMKVRASEGSDSLPLAAARSSDFLMWRFAALSSASSRTRSRSSCCWCSCSLPSRRACSASFSAAASCGLLGGLHALLHGVERALARVAEVVRRRPGPARSPGSLGAVLSVVLVAGAVRVGASIAPVSFSLSAVGVLVDGSEVAKPGPVPDGRGPVVGEARVRVMRSCSLVWGGVRCAAAFMRGQRTPSRRASSRARCPASWGR